MKPIPLLFILGLLATAAFPFFTRSSPEPPRPPAEAPPPDAPPLADSLRSQYVEFAMEDVFVMPAGPKGLEYTAKAKSLDGRKVRVEGHMVRHAHADPQVFLFAPRRMVLFQAEFGTADDLPPYALHVITRSAPQGKAAGYLKDRVRLWGELQLGPRQEIDGRVSHARLLLDHVTEPETDLPVPYLASLAMQPERMANSRRANPPPSP